MSPPPFDPQPILEGQTIRLRPLAESDYDALYLAASDPLIWAQHPCPERYKREVFDEQYLNPAVIGRTTLVVIDKASNQIIGSSRYYDINADAHELAIGYTFLARSHWGGLVNSEMKKLMLDHAFSWAKKIWFHVGASNIRSRKAMGKIGARLDRDLPITIDGKPVAHVCFYINREDWKK